jgi:hypothetical protein
MASWRDVHGYITSNYHIKSENEGLLTIDFETDNLRSQLVIVTGDDDLVVFQSPFAKIGQVQPGKVFELANVFGVRQIGDMYCVTHVALTPSIDTSEIDVPLQLMAANADEIERGLGLANNF